MKSRTRPPVTHAALDVVGEHLQVGPAEIEHAAEVAEGLQDAQRRLSSRREMLMRPSMHFQDRDGGRVVRKSNSRASQFSGLQKRAE